jgi:hypothetical protein
MQEEKQMSKIINKFTVVVKAAPDKNYYSTEYTIDDQYILKAGDRIAALRYEGRGIIFYDLLILDVSEKNIKVLSSWHEKSLTFEYDKEPNYKEIVEHIGFSGEENRKLILYPFPLLAESVKIQEFKESKIKISKEIFHDRKKEVYLSNFSNINEVQFSLI